MLLKNSYYRPLNLAKFNREVLVEIPEVKIGQRENINADHENLDGKYLKNS